APFSFTTIQVCTAKMLRHRTVRAANTRITASGCLLATGRSPALERSAVCQLPRPSPSQKYRAADVAIGPKIRRRKTSKIFFNGLLLRIAATIYVLSTQAPWPRNDDLLGEPTPPNARAAQ